MFETFSFAIVSNMLFIAIAPIFYLDGEFPFTPK